MPQVSEEVLSDEFGIFGCDVDDEFFPKLIDLCLLFHLNEGELAQEWVAFKCSKNLPVMNMSSLEKFEREWLPKQGSKATKSEKRRSATNDTFGQRIGDEEVDLVSQYTDAPLQGGKSAGKRQVTPEDRNVWRKRLAAGSDRSPAVPFSPNSFSPAPASKVSPSSSKFSSRTSAGEVLVNFGTTDNVVWKGNSEGCTVEPFNSAQTLSRQYKYMFQKLSEKAHVLNDQIEEMSDLLKTKHLIEEFSHVAIPTQDVVQVSGRIACDSQGKMNSQSVVLEGSRETSSGQHIPLDLSELTEYALFPGQVVAADAVNITGKKLILKKLYPSVPLPLPEAKVKSENGAVLRAIIAAGPFSTSDNLSYEPLLELLAKVREDRADVCILIGPFVDMKNTLIESGKLDQTYEAVFRRQMEIIADETKRLNCRVVLVPSSRDVHHHPVYPQGPFDLSDKPLNFYMAPDPCTLVINNIVFGITSTDILFHLGAEEVAQCPPGTTDRLGRLVQHLLDQHSYYPLYPPSEDVNADLEHFEEGVYMPITPHVLLTPSDLRYFIKDSQGCCCVNPGRLAKGQIGGTYARLVLQPPTTSQPVSLVPTMAGQILRI